MKYDYTCLRRDRDLERDLEVLVDDLDVDDELEDEELLLLLLDDRLLLLDL